MVSAEQHRLEGGGLVGTERIQRLVDPLDQLPGPDLVRDARRRIDLVLADLGHEIQLREVADTCRTVHGHQRAEPGAQGVDLILDVVGRDIHRIDRQGQVAVRGQCELGADIHLDGEKQVAAEVLDLGPGGDVGLGPAENPDVLLGDRLSVELVEPVVDGVVEHLFAADPLVDKLRRHLALAEARDVDLLADVLVGVRDAGLELVGGDGDAELDPRGAEPLDGGLHAGALLWM